jgi:putative salt-induced outer membrane protein YdiY
MTGFSHDLIVESGSSNTSIESIAALRARLVGNLALVFSYRIKRNSDVPADIEDTDTFTSVALEYAF